LRRPLVLLEVHRGRVAAANQHPNAFVGAWHICTGSQRGERRRAADLEERRDILSLLLQARTEEGEALDDVIGPLIAEDQAARLSALEDEFG